MHGANLQAEVEEALDRDDPIELMDVVIALATDGPDRDFAETCCVRLARHRNATVRGNALLGFAHLARRFGRLDGNRVKRLVDIGLHDTNEYVRENAQAAAEDLSTFLSWHFDPPVDDPARS
jgi:hypothetical protein